jgi:hypothetical protein
VCKLETSDGNASYPNGFCTLECGASSGQCGDLGGVCSQDFLAFGEADTLCLPTCTGPGTCGLTGYDCYNAELILGGGQCWISPLPSEPAATAGEIGRACTSNSQCGPPPYDGVCIEALDAGVSTGWVGGYCTAGCQLTTDTLTLGFSADDAHCGDGGICVNFGDDFFDPAFSCREGCSGPLTGRSTCRTGYICDWLTGTDGGVAPEGYCQPNCQNTGAGCPSGYGCTSLGYCCEDAGDCL